MVSFLEACGARGPLLIDVEAPGAAAPARHAFDRPTVLIGRHGRADLRLDHADVSTRHALIQVVDGRPFVVDLESRTGTHRDTDAGPAGWLDGDRPIRIGPYRLRAYPATGGLAPPAGAADPPSPLSSSYARPRRLPEAVFDPPDGGAPFALTRAITLIGCGASCRLRVEDPDASLVYGALVRTPDGVWFVDLLASRPPRINGDRVREARLRPGDELRIGPYAYRLRPAGATGPAGELALPARPGGGGLARSPRARGGLVAEVDDRPLLELVARLQEQTSAQVRDALVLLTQHFGALHRDHMEMVQGELAEIRRLGDEIRALRATGGAPAAPAGPAPMATPGPARPVAAGDPGPTPDVPAPADPASPRPDPKEVLDLVSERLAAFERERETRWGRIRRYLASDS